MSRTVPFEVHPSEPLRLVVTLTDNSKCEVSVQLAVISVTDHEVLVPDGAGRLVPGVHVQMHPLITARPLGATEESPALPPGVSGRLN